MAILYLDQSYSLRRVMRERMYVHFHAKQRAQLRAQLQDAARNSHRETRREEYAKYLKEFEAYVAGHSDGQEEGK